MKNLRIVFVFLLFFSLAESPVNNSYYVSPTGKDTSSGVLTSPWKTIQKCLNTARGGDSCLIRAGTYNESLSIKTGGVSGSPITIQNYNNEIVTVNSGNSMSLVTTGHQSYYVISGLRFVSTISGGEGTYTIDLSKGLTYSPTAIGDGNGNIVLKDCYVEGAILLYGPNNTVQDCELSGRNVLNDGITSNGLSSPNVDIKNNAIHDYLGKAVELNGTADNALVIGNEIYNTYLGIDVDGAGRPVTNAHVLNNTIYHTGGIYNGDFHAGWGCSIFLENAFNAIVSWNLIYGSPKADGIYITNYGVGGGNPSFHTAGNIEYRNQNLNTVISNNTIYGQGRAMQVTSANGVLLYNNTITGTIIMNGDTSDAGVTYYPQNWMVKNNSFLGTGPEWSFANSADNVSSYLANIYWGGITP